MSLLLEALKRAEDKGRRRRAGAAPVPGAALPQDALAELAAPAEPPAAHVLGLSGPDDPMIPVELSSPADEPAFPALEAVPPEPSLSLAPVEAVAPAAPSTPPPSATGPTARPVAPTPAAPAPGPQAAAARAAPRAARRATAAPIATPPASPAPAPTASPADVRAADRLLKAQAGASGNAGAPARGKARQVWLLATVTLVAAGVGLLWFWPQDEPPVRRPPMQPPVAAGPIESAVPAPTPAANGNPVAQAAPPAAAPAVAATPASGAALPAAPADVARAPVVAQSLPTVRADGAASGPVAAPRPAAEPSRPVAAAPTSSTGGSRPVRAARAPAVEPPAPAAPSISPRQAAANQLQARLQQAFADFQAGRLQEATQAWRDIVTADPTQRDAWLGLAIAAHRQGQRDAALAGYQQVLRLDPENAEAVAGLVALEAAGSDTASESRLREALSRNPGQASLNSALARLLSQQGRWDEAQPFWFAAHTAAPGQASHAYNLAVSLDRLRKPALAAQYYRKALELQQGQAPSFDVAAARARLQALEDRPVPAQP